MYAMFKSSISQSLTFGEPPKYFCISGNLYMKTIMYHEWPHRQCSNNVCWRYRVHLPPVKLGFVAHICTMQVALTRYCPVKRGGITASQGDLSSLTALFIAACGWLQLGVAHWNNSVNLLPVVDNSPDRDGCRIKVYSALGGFWLINAWPLWYIHFNLFSISFAG